MISPLRKPANRCGSTAVLFSIGALSMPLPLSADEWTNASGNRRWSTGSNWGDLTEPTSGESALFPAGFPGGGTSILLSTGEAASLLSVGDNYSFNNINLVEDTSTLTLGNGVTDGVIHVAEGKSATIRVRVSCPFGTPNWTKIGNGAVTLSRTLVVPDVLRVEAGTLTLVGSADISGRRGVIGTPGNSAVVTINGVEWNLAVFFSFSTLEIGAGGSGTLNVTGGGQVANDGFALLEPGSGHSATINVSGSGSLANLGSVFLEGQGDSSINITGGTLLAGLISAGEPGVNTLTLDGGTLETGEVDGIDQLHFRSGTLKNVGQINDGSGIEKTDTGTLTLAGANTYTGVTTVSEGTLALANSQQLDALSMSAAGRYAVALSGLTPGADYAQLLLSGHAALGGTLDVSLAGGFVPQIGDSFVIMTYASRESGFENAVLPPLPDGQLALLHGPTELRLVVVPDCPFVGSDLDGDCDVDLDDFGLFQVCTSGPNVPQNDVGCLVADFDGDVDVDHSDFGVFQGCFSGSGIPADSSCEQ